MQFTIEQHIAAPCDAVEARLLDRRFVAASAALPRLDDCQVLDEQETAGRVRLRIRRRFAGSLPPGVTAVIDPHRLSWVEEVVWDRARRTGDHVIVADHYADRLRCHFTTTLTADGEGSRRIAAGDLTVRALVGARAVERAIVDGLREYAGAEAGLLGTWTAAPS